LHKQVLPFLLRRLKEDVLNDLPPKIIQDYYCELSEVQKELYDDFAQSQAQGVVQDVVANGRAPGKQHHVFQSLQYLRKLCNHPALVLKGDQQAIDAVLERVQNKAERSNSLHDIQHAPKLQALRLVPAFSQIARDADVRPDNFCWTAVSEGLQAWIWLKASWTTWVTRLESTVEGSRSTVFWCFVN
jgi:SNF2 family DNA or RNA helicase